jgi:hypothetical protein
MTQVDLKTVTQEAFSKHLNTEFELHFEEKDSIKLELIEVEDKSNEHVETFSLTFVGTDQIVLSQKIYKITHKEMGEMNIFIVPFHKNDKGVHYQAIFSRLNER